MEMEFVLSQDELSTLLKELDLKNHPGIYLLSGDLASGKTTLVKAMVKDLGSSINATSPTYLTQLDYGNEIYHYDIYHKDLKGLFAFGFLEELEREGWHFVEWGDRVLAKVLEDIGLSCWQIHVTKELDKRKYIIKEY